MDKQKFQNCISACWQCVTACQSCALACTNENDIEMMAKCIALNIECAILGSTTAQLLAIDSFYAKELVKICAEICSNCAEECFKYKYKHCQSCAKACEHCAIACNAIFV
ncbi:MAG: hypothetical protein K0S24_1045 [Sphingobacterium sp.]|jgi:hypothetical protein|nr:hypothetical protein [Sphingobacterium sp.]